MSYPWKLEFSPDDLSVSNASASRVDISELVKAGTLRWRAGTARLGDEPQAGEMSFTLLGRDFEPLYADSPRYPDVVRKRRFFLSFDRGSGFVGEFVGYARTFQPVWPGNVTHQEVEVVCGDGFDILSDDRLPALDPPEATTYEDVVGFDKPSFQYGLNEPEGTKVVSHVRKKRKRRKGEGRKHYRRHGIKRWKTRETRAEVEGVSGPSGTYKNTPQVGEPGAILGDPDTAVLFRTAQSEYARIGPLDQADLVSTNRLTIEAWVYPLTAPGASNRGIVSFAVDGSGVHAWLAHIPGGNVMFSIADAVVNATEAQTALTLNVWSYLVGTWDGQTARLYLDGDLVDSSSGARTMGQGDAGEYLYIGRYPGAADFDGRIDEVALYEKALSPERILAHYTAGTARGYPEQTAGERILDAATHALWDESNIAASAFNVQPQMKYGQSPLEVIEEAMAAEGIRTLFGFDGDGDPFYLGWEWKANSPYNTVQATFGSPQESGELAFDTEQLRYDDEVYNEATLSRDGGEAITVEKTSSQEAYGRSAAEPITGLLTADDARVRNIGGELLALYATPTWALDTLDLHGSDPDQEEQIFALGLGSLIRYKRRAVDENTGAVGDPIDVVTHVLGYEKSLDAGDVVTCTFQLARGFNAAAGVWRAGIVGFSEAGSTTVAA